MKKIIVLVLAVLVAIVVFVAMTRTSSGVVVDSYLDVIRVRAEDMENPVLGMAFHLEYPEGWNYLDYEPGDFFVFPDHGPVILVSDIGGKLVVGISLKRGETLPRGNGDIIRFNFENLSDSRDFKISNMSVREVVDGEVREADVKWRW